MQTVVEAIHLDVLNRDYYNNSTTPIKFAGVWPKDQEFAENFYSVLANMTNSDGEQIGWIEYTFFNKYTQSAMYPRSYTEHGPTGKWNVVYIEFVHIKPSWQGGRVSLLDDPNSSVSFATLMVTEFLRQAMASPNVDKAFLYISSENPLGAFTAYVNAGLYNNLTVTEKIVNEVISIHYDATEQQKYDLIIPEKIPGAKRAKRTHATVKEEEELHPGKKSYEVVQKITEGGSEKLEFSLKWLGVTKLMCTLLIGEYLITADVTHHNFKEEDYQLIPQMYYFLLRDVIKSLSVQYGVNKEVAFSFTEEVVPPSPSIMLAFLGGYASQAQMVSDRAYNVTLTSAIPMKKKYDSSVEEINSHLEYVDAKIGIEVSFDLYRCIDWGKELKKHIDEYVEVDVKISSVLEKIDWQIALDPENPQLRALRLSLEEERKRYESMKKRCTEAYEHLSLYLAKIKNYSNADKQTLKSLETGAPDGKAWEMDALKNLIKDMETKYPNQRFALNDNTIFSRWKFPQERTVTKDDLPKRRK